MYEAADAGLIRSKARSISVSLNGGRIRKAVPGHLLAQSLMTLNGQPHYATVKAGGRMLYVHRLVATAWRSDAYFEGPEVNHLNGNRRDNGASNLEWTSHRQNILHSCRTLHTLRKRPQPGSGSRLEYGRRRA